MNLVLEIDKVVVSLLSKGDVAQHSASKVRADTGRSGRQLHGQ